MEMNIYRPHPIFMDRTDAGRRLAQELIAYKDKDAVIFAVPRGGVPVAIEVADRLKAPLDIVIVRKVPIPSQPDTGFGAVTEDGTLILNEPLLKRLNLDQIQIDKQVGQVRMEIIRSSMIYRRKLQPSPVKGRIAIIIDDGLSSGYTMLAAIQSLRKRKASQVLVAVPVAAEAACNLVETAADDIFYLEIVRLEGFVLASFYQNWNVMNDEQVNQFLEAWRVKNAAV
jgi:putative phosphoribosyl transferase